MKPFRRQICRSMPRTPVHRVRSLCLFNETATLLFAIQHCVCTLFLATGNWYHWINHATCLARPRRYPPTASRQTGKRSGRRAKTGTTLGHWSYSRSWTLEALKWSRRNQGRILHFRFSSSPMRLQWWPILRITLLCCCYWLRNRVWSKLPHVDTALHRQTGIYELQRALRQAIASWSNGTRLLLRRFCMLHGA